MTETWELRAWAAAWKPSAGWASTLREPYEALVRGVTGLDASAAWSTIAMVLGDSGATPLALVVCLHAQRGLPANVEDRRLLAHRDLCLLDLGLASSPTTAVRLGDLGVPGTLDAPQPPIDAWLARALEPFAGDLAAAAAYILELAAVRTGLVAGPEPAP